MRYYLYKFNCPSCETEGFAALTEKQKDIIYAEFKKEYKRGGTFYVGDEEIVVDSFEELMNTIAFEQIDKMEYDTLRQLFRSNVHLEDGCFGPLGPLNIEDVDFLSDEDEDEDEDDYERCEECDSILDESENFVCDRCKAEEEEEQEENEYNEGANKISGFIVKTYGLINDVQDSKYHSQFKWNPMPKAELQITILNFDESDCHSDVEVALKIGNKTIGYEYYSVDEICDNPKIKFEKTIKEFIEKSKQY